MLIGNGVQRVELAVVLVIWKAIGGCLAISSSFYGVTVH